ncbi:unnamed protein product [Chironomus riparius]|uniref:J domain-containing protein n=1 Tax=Chironomus riparius TaxID=315576 RepID=A0A9N9S516_9DIPT|nr:unnamed protein product [Chironomus riparius]
MIRNFERFLTCNFRQITAQRRNLNVQNFMIARSYCQLSKMCWNCHATLHENVEIFCNSCNHIQRVPKISFEDYFDLFGIQKDPKVNLKELTKRFRNVQSQIHPDKFSTKSEAEQSLSSEWSSLVNKAYKTLQTPVLRGEYLLSLKGITISEKNTIEDPEFLMEVMEKNETVEEAETKDDLLVLLDELQDEIADVNNKFASAYQSKNYAAAKNYLIKMKYLMSIENITKEKIQRF